MKFGLKVEVIGKMQAVFACFPDVERVSLYGSRAKSLPRIKELPDYPHVGDE